MKQSELNRRTVIAALAAGAMGSAAAGAKLLTPTKRYADILGNPSLDTLLPTSFGRWAEDRSIVPLMPDPTTLETLTTIYSQTLSRTYVSTSGQRVMLSLAYGGDQSRELQVHRPEVCYVAQGFTISGVQKVGLQLAPDVQLPAMRLVAVRGARRELITYWVRIGDKLVRGNIEQGLARAEYGLSGYIPDGLLFRASTLGADDAAEYKTQDQFIAELMATISPNEKRYLVGTPTAGNVT